MKTISTSGKTLRFFFLLSTISLLIVSCEKQDKTDEDSPCGASQLWFANYDVEADIVWEELFGNLRTIEYGLNGEPEDICRDEHVILDYLVETYGDTALPNLLVRGKSSWGSFGHNKSLSWVEDSDPSYFGYDEVGLTQGFEEDEPGYIDLNIEFTFPTTGSLAGDKQWLKDHIKYIRASCSYQKKK